MQNLISFLKRDLSLPEKLILQVVDFYEVEHFSKDEFLIKKGKFYHKMCLIDQGYLRLFSYSEKKVITHWIFGKEQLVTDVTSFFLQQPTKWNIQALVDTTVLP